MKAKIAVCAIIAIFGFAKIEKTQAQLLVSDTQAMVGDWTRWADEWAYWGMRWCGHDWSQGPCEDGEWQVVKQELTEFRIMMRNMQQVLAAAQNLKNLAGYIEDRDIRGAIVQSDQIARRLEYLGVDVGSSRQVLRDAYDISRMPVVRDWVKEVEQREYEQDRRRREEQQNQQNGVYTAQNGQEYGGDYRGPNASRYERIENSQEVVVDNWQSVIAARELGDRRRQALAGIEGNIREIAETEYDEDFQMDAARLTQEQIELEQNQQIAGYLSTLVEYEDERRAEEAQMVEDMTRSELAVAARRAEAWGTFTNGFANAEEALLESLAED